MNQLTEKRETYLDTLIEQLDAIGTWYHEYNTENEDNGYADYCSWGWTESELYLDGFDDDIQPMVDLLKVLVSDDREFDKALVDCSTLSYTAGYGANRNEIFSCSIGEYEIQLDGNDEQEKLIADLDALNGDDWEYIRRRADYAPSPENTGYMYGSDDGRWSLIVDEGQLADHLRDLIKESLGELSDHSETIADILQSE